MGFICYCLVVAVYLFSSCAVCLVAWPQEVEDPSLVTVFSFMLMIMILAFLVLTLCQLLAPGEAYDIITFGKSTKKSTDSQLIGMYGNGLKS